MAHCAFSKHLQWGIKRKALNWKWARERQPWSLWVWQRTSGLCWGTGDLAADSGPMNLFPILWVGARLYSYSNISVFLWLASCAFGQNGLIGLKLFVHIFVQMVNLFADMTTVSEVLHPNCQVPIVTAKICNPGSLVDWWKCFVLKDFAS